MILTGRSGYPGACAAAAPATTSAAQSTSARAITFATPMAFLLVISFDPPRPDHAWHSDECAWRMQTRPVRRNVRPPSPPATDSLPGAEPLNLVLSIQMPNRVPHP